MKYSWKTLHSSPERARYGVSFVSSTCSKGNILCRLIKIELYKIFAIINRAIKGLHCNYTWIKIKCWFWNLLLYLPFQYKYAMRDFFIKSDGLMTVLPKYNCNLYSWKDSLDIEAVMCLTDLNKFWLPGLSHCGHNIMAAISRLHFQMHFLNENVWILIKISPKFVTEDPISNILALFLIMAWCQ